MSVEPQQWVSLDEAMAAVDRHLAWCDSKGVRWPAFPHAIPLPCGTYRRADLNAADDYARKRLREGPK